MHFCFNFDVSSMHLTFGSRHLKHQNLSVFFIILSQFTLKSECAVIYPSATSHDVFGGFVEIWNSYIFGSALYMYTKFESVKLID